MDVELKLPYAERYTIYFPQKKNEYKKLDEYVSNYLVDYHPGFNCESLWDYKVVTDDGIRKIEAVVLSRDFYLEKRLSDEKIIFYITVGNSQKIRFFESSDFNEKGERKIKKRYGFVIVVAILFAISGFFLFMKTRNKSEVVLETRDEIIVIENALNIFDVLNSCAEVIKEHDAKVQSIHYAVENKGHIKILVSDCEPYSLVNDICSRKYIETCRCTNIIYNKGKENFELDILVTLSPILQSGIGEIELLALQNQFINKLHNIKTNLVTTGISPDTGRISAVMECMLNDLSVANNVLNDFIEENNLFITTLEESCLDNKVTVKIDFICLSENQNLEKSIINEKISEVFKSEKKDHVEIINREEKYQKLINTNKTKNWKKIGVVKKEGRQLYYYRTDEGKIEISEDNYE